VDGTMVDNRAYHERAWIELGRRHGVEITPETYRKHIHSRPNDANARFLFGPRDGERLAARISDEKEAIYRATFAPVMREIAGLSALLAALAEERVPCAAVSNSPAENVDMVLDGLRIRHRFRTVLNVSHVARGKPDPEILLRAAAELEVAPAACVLLEDSISGFLAARAASMPYVVITAGADPEELPRAIGARAIHRDFTTVSVGELRSCALGSPAPTRSRSGTRPGTPGPPPG
jgi:beta-phosphoglucomutase